MTSHVTLFIKQLYPTTAKLLNWHEQLNTDDNLSGYFKPLFKSHRYVYCVYKVVLTVYFAEQVSETDCRLLYFRHGMTTK